MVEIIAEIGSNFVLGGGEQTWEEKFERALGLIESAAGYGADTVKFQLFRAEYLYKDPPEELYDRELPLEWIPALVDCAEENGVEFLCTPFYLSAVDELDPYISRWKIASWDITYIPLLQKIAETEKPVIVSTGAATVTEISNALKVWDNYWGTRDWIARDNHMTLLHCTPSYPTTIEHAQLERVEFLRRWFPVRTGLSSHIVGENRHAAIAAIASSVGLGGEVIEVHYDSDGKGAEAPHSLIAEDLWELREYSDAIQSSLAVKNRDVQHYQEMLDYARASFRRDLETGLRPSPQ